MISKNWRIIVLAVFTFVLFRQPVIAEEMLTLDAVVEIALKQSHVINMAKEGVRGATAQKEEAFTGFLPKLNTSYSYTRLNEAASLKVEELTGFLSFLNGSEFPLGTKDNYNWTFEVRQPLFAGGAIMANYEASRLGEDAAHIEETAKYQDVVQDVTIAYFNVLRAQRIRDTARQSVEMLNAHYDVAENFFKAGMIPENDLLHAEVELANGRQALVRAQNIVELAKSRLNIILKRNLSAPVTVVDILEYRPLKQSLEECLTVAVRERPELKISSLKAQQAGKLVRMAKSEYFPALSLVGDYSRFGDTPSTSGSAYKDMESWQVMAVASWNLWEWGKTKYRVEASKARENQAVEASRELNEQISLEIKNAYLMLREAESQIAVSRKVINQAQENFRISEERYKENISTSTVVLEAQTLLTKAKSEYANALGDYNINYVKLQRAMGTIGKTSEEKIRTEERNPATNTDGSAKSDKTDPSDAPPAVPAAAVNSAPVITEQNAVKPVAEKAASTAAGSSALVVNEQKNAVKPVPGEEVRILVNKWLAGWQSGDMETYRSCYTADFKSKRMDLNAWISYKTNIRQKHGEISIRIDDVAISADAGASTAEAVFTQYYSSPVLKDKVRKTLKLKNVNGEWKIFQETAALLK